MIVFGDPEYAISFSAAVACLQSRFRASTSNSVDEWRRAVIGLGQLEQGFADYVKTLDGAEGERLARIERLTDRAAQCFCRKLEAPNRPPPVTSSALVGEFSALASELGLLMRGADRKLSIKIPEGFAFYALFPEQYYLAALKWAQGRGDCRLGAVLVAGVRSIGTALSAVVKAALESAGWKVKRFTIRPRGHPFDREVELPSQSLSGFTSAIIVDEGPGVSGSSMAAVAEALAQKGLGDLAFFPGHAHEPGNVASAKIQKWWSSLPRHFVPLEKVRWDGRSLAEWLLNLAESLGVSGSAGGLPFSGGFSSNGGQIDSGRLPLPSPSISDLSAGRWRWLAYQSESQWPAVCETFERRKCLCVTASGKAVLWKFSGLGFPLDNDQARRPPASLAESRWSVPDLGSFNGFRATPWVIGQRLRAIEASAPNLQEVLGQYLASSVGPPLPAAEAQAAFHRLAEMSYCNTKELLGDSLADRVRRLGEVIPAVPASAYTDGRPAPHEWVRTAAGELIKTDDTGHEADHTMVGRQPVLWDVAGTLIEWDLAPDQAPVLLAVLRSRGLEIQPANLLFYQLAYAAFRTGMNWLALTWQKADANESRRLQAAVDYYREKLRALLLEPFPR